MENKENKENKENIENTENTENTEQQKSEKEIKRVVFRISILAGFLGAMVVLVGSCLGMYLINRGHVITNSEYVRKLEYLEELIDREYLEEKDEENLAEGLYTGLVYGLGDVYSRYYTAEEYEKEYSTTEGSYVGIGILMQENQDGGIRVAECYEGSPAEEAGLEADDVISAVDETDVTEMELPDVADMIKNSEKETVVLTVHRKGVEEPLKLEVAISDVELPSVFPEMLEDQVGYIRISQFTGVTFEQYQKAFEELKEQGMEKLVIDLRDNPGGLLTSVCDVLNEILPEGLIVYTEDKNGERLEKFADGEHPLELPLAVLVNEGSASAAEIFAGAVKDYGIGTIVGTTTYGKGVVQSIFQLKDGSAVKLTTSRYYTPKGECIDKTGIEPDVEVKLDPELLNRDEIAHEEDNQLQAAIAGLE